MHARVRAFIRTRVRCVYTCTGPKIRNNNQKGRPPHPRDSGGQLEAHLFQRIGIGAHLGKDRVK